MKTIRSLVIVVATVLMTSCASTAKFPVSSTVPAAEITATKKQDKKGTYLTQQALKFPALGLISN